MTRKRRQLITCFGLVAYFLSSIMGVEGLVLCLGQNGHMGVEPASFDLTCGTMVPEYGIHADAPIQTGVSDKGHCGPCLDVPFALTRADALASARSYTVPVQGETVKIQLITDATPTFSILPTIEELPSGKLLQQPPTSYPSLASLRTIILII